MHTKLLTGSTYRVSVKTGFYKVIEILLQLSRSRPRMNSPIEIPAKRLASLNLIPVDLVVLEMMDIICASTNSIGAVYHITNERPVSLTDLFFAVTPLTGVLLTCGSEARPPPICQASALVTRSLGQYLPYFSYAQTFDRQNVHAVGAGHHQQNFWLDLTKIREFVRAFIEAENYQSVQILKVDA